jgi:hypothetical protein
MLDLVHEQLGQGDSAAAREHAYFAGAKLDDAELREAGAEQDSIRARARARQAEATRSNLGLGHDLRAGLIQPSDAQLRAVRQIVWRLPIRNYGELIAYGAGWTDPERQRPVGDTGRHEPGQPDYIVDVELQGALDDPEPLRGIAQLTARLEAAFVLDTAGVTRTKALGSERMARKLRDALPGGDGALRTSVRDPCARRCRLRWSRSIARGSSSRTAPRRPSISRPAARPRVSMSLTSASPAARPRKPDGVPVPPAQPLLIAARAGGKERLRVLLFARRIDPAHAVGINGPRAGYGGRRRSDCNAAGSISC